VRRALAIISILAVVALAACKRVSVYTYKAGEPSPAPTFAITDVAGKPLNLADFKGKVVLLDFWATWCGPCKVEIPHFVEFQKKYGPQGLQIVGLSLDDDGKPVREFAQKMGINYPVALADEKLTTRYGGILGLPVAFVIDRNGNIVKKFTGETQPELFEQEIKKAL
jgi:cytochrome c biogenesis protein CcmG, thiol:disulfide interchange protein DsbE